MTVPKPGGHRDIISFAEPIAARDAACHKMSAVIENKTRYICNPSGSIVFPNDSEANQTIISQ